MLLLQAWKFGKFRETIHRYRVCIPCGNDETNFCFPQQILAKTIRKGRKLENDKILISLIFNFGEKTSGI